MSGMPWEGANLPIPIEGVNIVVVSIVFEVCAIAAVILRLWSRQIKKKALVFNDYAVIVGLFFTTGLVIDLLIAVYRGGEGQHSKFLGMKQFRVWSRVFFTGQLLWAAGNCGVKLSILHLYTTIFRGSTFKRFCYILMALSVAYMLMTILVDFLICTPVALNWDDFVQGHCGNQRMAYLFTGIINLLIDVGIVVLPMPLVWKLQMPVAKRVGVSAMFGLGALICVLTILRINSVQILDLTDVTSSCAPLALWTVLEPTLGVVNACLPVMRPALQKIFGSDAILWTLLSTRSSESKSSKGSKLLGSSFKGDNMVDAGRENDFQRLYDDRHTLAEQKNIVQAERIEKGSRGGGTGRMKQGSTAMGVIEVTNGWDVDSVKANTHDIV